MDVELADLMATRSLQSLKEIKAEDRLKKIDLLFSFGYIYTPYDRCFVNPLRNSSIKITVLFESYERILNSLYNIIPEAYSEESLEKRINYVYTRYDKSFFIRKFLALYSIQFGILLFILGMI